MEEKVTFNSEGETLSGVLTRPAGVKGPVPLVVMAGGWCYVKEIVMPYYAKYFHDIGCATLRFDYRTFGESTGAPRQHLDPWKQIEDYRNAISFAETLPNIDLERTGIWGISYSGGHVLIVAAIDQRAKFAISTIPVVDGFQTTRRNHGEARFRELLKVLDEDRRNRFKGKTSAKLPVAPSDPYKEWSGWPIPLVKEIFLQIKEREAPNYELWNTTESVELLLNYNVFPYCERIIETPVLMTTAAGDNITSADLEAKAFNAITAPNKKFVAVEGVSHMSLYSDVNDLGKVGKVQGAWLKDWLASRDH